MKICFRESFEFSLEFFNFREHFHSVFHETNTISSHIFEKNAKYIFFTKRTVHYENFFGLFTPNPTSFTLYFHYKLFLETFEKLFCYEVKEKRQLIIQLCNVFFFLSEF